VIVALAGSPVWMLCGWDCVRRLAGRRMLAGMDGVARAGG
jgi:hypothetical protein